MDFLATLVPLPRLLLHRRLRLLPPSLHRSNTAEFFASNENFVNASTLFKCEWEVVLFALDIGEPAFFHAGEAVQFACLFAGM